MAESREWFAYRLDVLPSIDLFILIKTYLVDYVDENDLRFWVTWYFNEVTDRNPHIQFRVYVTHSEKSTIECYLDSLVHEGILIERHEATDWSPNSDAAIRVRGNRRMCESPGDTLIVDGYYHVPKQAYLNSINPDVERIEELGALFSAIGEATKAFYKALPRKPRDPYVMSLALHILINSLTYGGPDYPSEETNIRQFPPILSIYVSVH